MSRKILLCLAMLLFLFSFESAWAVQVGGVPDLLISSAGQGPATITPKGTTTDQVLLQNTTTNTDSPMSYSASGTGFSQNSSANPLGFQVNTSIAASLGTNYSTADGVVTWFVVNGGTPGSVVSLTTDINFQGRISASSATATAAFTNYLSFVSSTSSTEYDYLIVQNGVVSPQGPISNSLAGTVPNLQYNTPGTYDINEVIRSTTFDVTVGTPFRLALVLNATVGTNGFTDNTASVDWDPGFSSFFTPGAFALADGTPLGRAGYDQRR